MPDVIRPIDRLVVVAERISEYAAQLQELVAQVKAEKESDDQSS